MKLGRLYYVNSGENIFPSSAFSLRDFPTGRKDHYNLTQALPNDQVPVTVQDTTTNSRLPRLFGMFVNQFHFLWKVDTPLKLFQSPLSRGPSEKQQ